MYALVLVTRPALLKDGNRRGYEWASSLVHAGSIMLRFLWTTGAPAVPVRQALSVLQGVLRGAMRAPAIGANTAADGRRMFD